MIVLKISGKKSQEIFKNESGGHRWQRVPSNEKRGRVHTSTVTVAVMQEATSIDIKLDDKDLEYSICCSGGSGGQNVNKVSSAVQIKHKPTGLFVRCESERSQLHNKASALQLLRARLLEKKIAETSTLRSNERASQVGSGMRGDKRRTIRQQDNQVNDHLTGKSWRYEDYVKGIWS